MPHRALVADTDPTTRSQIAALLGRGGYTVETAEDGERAFARYLATMPDLVIAADGLPSRSGAELCQQIRELSSRVRIILLQGVPVAASDKERVQAEARCDVILFRPLRIEQLTEILTDWGLLAPAELPVDPGALAFGVPVNRADPEPATQPADPALPVPVPIPVPPLEATPVAVAPAARLTPLPRTRPAPMAPPARVTPLPQTRPAPMAPPARVTPMPPPPARSTAPAPMAPPARITPAPPPRAPEASAPDPVAAVALRGASRQPTAAASTLLPAGVSRFGDLATMPLPRLLYELYVGTYFGVLHLERERTRRTVYFWAGVPVRVDTDQLSDSLGAILRAEQRITEAQLNSAKEYALTHGTAIGVALVQTGALHERDLLEALTRQVERKLVSTFAWRDGRYVAHDDTTFVNDTVLNDVRPLDVIWQGVCEHYEVGALLHFFSRHRERHIVATDLYPLQATAFVDHLREIDLAWLLSGRTTFEQALVSDPAHTVQIARALYVLMVTDAVKPSDQTGPPAPDLTAVAAPDTPTLVDYAGLMAASERIAREYVRIKGRDAFAVLALEDDANTDLIERIFRDASARVQADRDLPGLPPEDDKRAREIAAVYTRAYDTLVDPSRREVYLRSLGAAPAPTAAPAAPAPPGNERRRALFAAEHAYDEGVALLEVSEPRAARDKFQTAVETHPDEATYRVAVARAILAGGADPGENGHAVAFELIEEALRIDPASLAANLEAAKLLVLDGMPESAREYLERVLQRAPDHPLARKMLREL